MATVGTTCAALAGLPLTACAPLVLVPSRRDGKNVLVRMSELEELAEEGFAHVTPDGHGGPILIYRDKQGVWSAVDGKCTHQGTNLKAVKGDIVCPLHGSRFAHSGQAISGPAKEPLNVYRVEVHGDELIITLT